MKKIWCGLLFFSVAVFQSLSADLNYPKKIVNGKTYYEYTVQKSEGYYSICKKFGVSEEEIKSVNPGTEKGLVYDVILLIPYKEPQYLVHKVDRKETLYSISKKYDVTIDDIYEMNPSVKKDGLKSGTEIKIPEKKKVNVQTLTVNDSLPKIQKENKPSFSVHEVVKGETLYSISRHYGISSDEIIRLNPDVKDGVKIGKKLIIPPVYANTSIKENSVEGRNLKYGTHLVQKKETLYSISKMYNVTIDEIVRLNPNVNDGLKVGMILVIPPSLTNTRLVADSTSVTDSEIGDAQLDSIVDIEKLFVRSLTPKKQINIAITLPFQLSKVTDKNKIDNNTKKFLEFYQGFLIAIDSLRNTGLSFNIYTYDSGKSESDIQKILEKPELKDLDILIGPAYTSQIKLMSKFALENNVKLVIPFSSKSEETLVNPNIFQINPPIDKINFLMADLFVKQFKGKNIVLWRFTNKPEYDDKKLFADTLSYLLTEKGIAFKTVIFDNSASIRAALVTDKENVVIPLTTNQVALSQALPMINTLQTDKRVIALFGFTEWQNYQSINKDMYVLNTYFATPFHVDFRNPEVRSYLTKFRHYYNAEPFNSQPQYGLLGYDMAIYFAQSVALHGHDFEFSESPIKVNTLQTKYKFTRIAEKGGFYSTGLFLTNHVDKVGMVAIDGSDMTMCQICAETVKKIESKQKRKK